MYKNNLKSGYVLFVGIPLLILIGTLRAGGHLTAPPALSGDWTVEPALENTCTEAPANGARPLMSIYQTGSELQIGFNEFPKATLIGRLENGRLAATRHAARCSVRLDAALAGAPGRRSLTGKISFDGCASCAPVRFIATRLPSPAGR